MKATRWQMAILLEGFEIYLGTLDYVDRNHQSLAGGGWLAGGIDHGLPGKVVVFGSDSLPAAQDKKECRNGH